MISRASVAKHPIHPMLVPIPIGLWIFSLVCDLIYLAQGDPLWDSMALYTMAGGIIGALLAALPGLIDLLALPPSPAKKMAIWHMSINLAIVALYIANFLWRRAAEPGATGPLVLSFAAVLMLLVSGWLGGELVYVHGVAVDPVGKKQPGVLNR